MTIACMLDTGPLARAQAPPIDLSGAWTLNTSLSDNPQQVAASIRVGLGEDDFGVFAGSADIDRNGRAMGRRQRPADAVRPRSTPSPEEQRAFDAITHPLRYPPPTLRIAQTAAAVTFTEGPSQSRTFQVNGKREEQVFDTARAESIARWEGPQLVIGFDLGKGRKMTYSSSVVATTRQMLVRVRFERAPNEPSPFEIKFVYDRDRA
jgi:hypothetical protein